MHVVLGTNDRESFRVADFIAYYRRVRARFLDFVAHPPETYRSPSLTARSAPGRPSASSVGSTTTT
jgi:hypothetical protein